jgi:hypothetical protein
MMPKVWFYRSARECWSWLVRQYSRVSRRSCGCLCYGRIHHIDRRRKTWRGLVLESVSCQKQFTSWSWHCEFKFENRADLLASTMLSRLTCRPPQLFDAPIHDDSYCNQIYDRVLLLLLLFWQSKLLATSKISYQTLSTTTIELEVIRTTIVCPQPAQLQCPQPP